MVIIAVSMSLLIPPSFVVLYVHRNHKAYQGRGTQDGHLDFHTAPELCIQSSVQYCFTSTETIWTNRDGEPRTATSTFTQVLNSVYCFTSTETIIMD